MRQQEYQLNMEMYMTLTFTWRGKMYAIKCYFPKVSKPQKAEVQNALTKIYPGSVLKDFK